MAHGSRVNLGNIHAYMKSSSLQRCGSYPVESCQERSVDKVGKDNEGVGLLQVEEEDGRDEGHALENHTCIFDYDL